MASKLRSRSRQREKWIRNEQGLCSGPCLVECSPRPVVPVSLSSLSNVHCLRPTWAYWARSSAVWCSLLWRWQRRWVRAGAIGCVTMVTKLLQLLPNLCSAILCCTGHMSLLGCWWGANILKSSWDSHRGNTGSIFCVSVLTAKRFVSGEEERVSVGISASSQNMVVTKVKA